MRRKSIYVILALLLTFGLAGCATKTIQIPDPRTLSAKDLGTMAMDLYKSQYKYHTYKANLPDLSEEEKQRLRDLKALLVKVKPALDTYIDLVDHNMAIDENLRIQIIVFVERFLYR
jgi:hypothetical protein